MGLDFSLYKKKKCLSIDDFYDSPINDEDELAYGRKSWELVSKLATNEDVNNGYGILTSDNWENLMRLMDPIGDLLEKISEAYNHYEYYLNHKDDDDRDIIDKAGIIFTAIDKELITQYEYWYDKTFNVNPVLGYEFSVGYMQDFYNAKDRVREVLKNPDYEVLMIISF